MNDRRILLNVPESADSFYSPENIAVLKKAIAQLDAGEGKEHELIEV